MAKILGRIVLASAAFVVALIAVGLIVGPAPPPTSTQSAPVIAERPPGVLPTPQPAPAPNLELLDHRGVVEETGFMKITGRVKNNSGKRYAYTQVTFAVSNAQGEQVGTAMANINGLEAGAVWKFTAVGIVTGGARYKLSALSGW